MEPEPESEGYEDGFVTIAMKTEHEPEVKRLKKGIINILKKSGSYEPDVDNIWVYNIAAATIYSKKTEAFLDAPTASEHTYTRIADTQAKFQRMVENGMRHLALTRRDRLNQPARAIRPHEENDLRPRPQSYHRGAEVTVGRTESSMIMPLDASTCNRSARQVKG